MRTVLALEPWWPGRGATQKLFGGKVCAGAVHLVGYLGADLDHPGRCNYTENTTTYVMVPHDIPRPFRWARTSIESCYDRPET